MNKELNNKIAVVIVNRNTKDLLRDCLESLPIGFSGIPYDVWVVDNASDDGSREMVRRACPDVHLICNAENLGFAKANNQALKQIKQPFAMLLNSDTVLTTDCVSVLYHSLIDNNKAAIVGPKLINIDGTLQPSTYPLPQLWKDLLMNFKFYKLLPAKMQSGLFLGSFWAHDEARRVGRIKGACLLVRMDDIRAVNFMDEDFFFYGETHDLCWRLWERGRESWFDPQAEVFHLGEQTSKQIWTDKEKRRRMWRENEKLLRRHQSSNVVRIGIVIKWISILLAIIKEGVAGFQEVTSIDKELLKVDIDWYNRRIKEWFGFKFGHLSGYYFRRRFYSIRFKKMFNQKFNICSSFDFDFKTEIDYIQKELIDKWNKSEYSRTRTGLMDFSCVSILYCIIRIFKPQLVVETGVANGASSTFILSAMEENGIGKLYSIDFSESEELSFVPRGKEVGWMIPDELRNRWLLQIGRTEERLENLLKQIGEIDIFLHDSAHTYETMMYEYNTAWPYIKKNGLMLSDDVKMTTAFDEFVSDVGSSSMVYKRRLGIVQKVE